MEKLSNDEQRKIVHKLRGPLTTIRLNTEVLLSGSVGKPTEEQHEYLQEVYSASDKLVTLLNDLSDASKPQNGQS